MIPYGRQSISKEDKAAVLEVLESSWLTQGPKVPRFERAIADFVGAAHAVAANSATSALHLACAALGVKPGDRVWTSPNSFVASANAPLCCGATIDFVDIELKTYNLDISHLEEKLLQAERKNILPKVLIPVHFAGQSCDMKKIKDLSEKFGFFIIEDASHAIGGRYKHHPIGDCSFSDVTVFSFHPVKIITSGEGGMAVTNKPELAEKMRLLCTHGITSNSELFFDRPKDEIWNYQQIGLGFNYRLTDLHAALGLSQLDRIRQFVSRRHQIASVYNRAFAQSPIVTPWQRPDSYSSFHLYPVRVPSDKKNPGRNTIYHRLRQSGIMVNMHYIPIYRQPYYEKLGFQIGYCPNAEKYFHEAISLPIFYELRETEQNKVIDALMENF